MRILKKGLGKACRNRWKKKYVVLCLSEKKSTQPFSDSQMWKACHEVQDGSGLP